MFHWIKLDHMPSQNQLLWLGDWRKVIANPGSHVYRWNQGMVQHHLTTTNDNGGGVDSQRKLLSCYQ